MNELLHLPESECGRTRGMLAQFVDDDLTAEQRTWLGRHLEACVECRAAMAGFSELDGELTRWGQHLSRRNPPLPEAKEQLAARLGPPVARHSAIHRLPAAVTAIAATIAAALALAIIAPQGKPPAMKPARALFVDIPYLPPLDPQENAAVVRVNIRVATLIAVGFKVAADPDAIVPADVLVGEDGRAHAVRVLSGIEWN